MEQTIYRCDICKKQIENYDPEKDNIALKVPTPENCGPILQSRDICLHCLATTIVIKMAVDGEKESANFINLLDKRAEKDKK